MRHYDQRPFDETMCDAIIANSAIIPKSAGWHGALNAPLSVTSLAARQGLRGLSRQLRTRSLDTSLDGCHLWVSSVGDGCHVENAST